MQSRRFKKFLVFVVLFIPVVWYQFLQLFGDNHFTLTVIGDTPWECKEYSDITIVSKNDSFSLRETNYMDRIMYAVDQRNIDFVYRSPDFFTCISQPKADLVLVDDEGVWGIYELTRDGVDRVLMELDILSLQKRK